MTIVALLRGRWTGDWVTHHTWLWWRRKCLWICENPWPLPSLPSMWAASRHNWIGTNQGDSRSLARARPCCRPPFYRSSCRRTPLTSDCFSAWFSVDKVCLCSNYIKNTIVRLCLIGTYWLVELPVEDALLVVTAGRRSAWATLSSC